MRGARRTGERPKRIPTTTEMPKARTTENPVTTAFCLGMKSRMSGGIATPRVRPRPCPLVQVSAVWHVGSVSIVEDDAFPPYFDCHGSLESGGLDNLLSR